jgi:hypothetical protein
MAGRPVVLCERSQAETHGGRVSIAKAVGEGVARVLEQQLSDARVVEYAASRYGRRNPSFDDVLSERFPLYNTDAIHTAGYHKLSALAFEVVLSRGLKRECVMCGAELMGHKTRQYCNDVCRSKAHHAKARPRGKNHPVTDAERVRMREMYEAGRTVIEIGLELTRSYSAVARELHAQGVKMRRSGARPKAIRERRAAA